MNEPRRSDQRPQTIELIDKGGETRLRFLAREARTRNGQIVAIKSGVGRLKLSQAKKEIAVWGKGDYRTAMITSEGYRSVQVLAQINVLTPPSIEVPGLGVQANPYLVTDDATGQFRAGWVRKIAIAPGPLGNLVITDRTTYLTLYEYLIEDLIGVHRRNPAAVLWGTRRVSPADLLEMAVEDHNEELDEKITAYKAKGWKTDRMESQRIGEKAIKRSKRSVERGLWDFFEIEKLTGTGLWFDRTSQAVGSVFRTYAQTGKFGVRKLEAIAFRNVMRDHPLTPGMTLDPKALVEIVDDRRNVIDVVAHVPVFFHEQIEGEEEIRQIFRDYETGLRTASLVSLPAGTETDRNAEPEAVSVKDANTDEDSDDTPKSDSEVEALTDERPDELSEGDERGALIARIMTGEEILGEKAMNSLLAEGDEIEEAGGLEKAPLEVLQRYFARLNEAVSKIEERKAD